MIELGITNEYNNEILLYIVSYHLTSGISEE